jgi:hypothetical protein
MGIKGLKISMIVNISFDTEAIPRLNPQQREQAIGRLHAGQPARVIANDFNIFNDYFGIKNNFFKCDVSFAVQCILYNGRDLIQGNNYYEYFVKLPLY